VEEKIVVLTLDHHDPTCAKCENVMAAGERAVFCPRCRTPHHLQCWIDHGGCSKKGCRQRVSPELLPAKVDRPIRASKAPTWVFVAALALIAALGVGLWFNATRSAEQRMRTVAVMLPASVDQSLWASLMTEYEPRLAANGKTILLTFVPEIVPVMDGQTIEAGYYDQKLLIQMAANDAPELVLLSARRLPTFVSQGALAPLDDVAERLDSIVDPARLAISELEGIAYGIPVPGQDAYLAIPRTSKHPDLAKDLLEFVVTELDRRKAESASN